MTTAKGGQKNQKATNVNYEQKLFSIFLKTIDNQIKNASDKTYTKQISYIIRRNMEFFLNTTGAKLTRNEQMDKV